MTDAKTTANDAAHETESRLREGLDTVRETASKVYHDAGDKASEVLEVSREKTKRVVNNLESNPLGILVGGLAVGALAGALLPRSAREKELLAPVGKRLSETLVAATAAAKDAGRVGTRRTRPDQGRCTRPGQGPARGCRQGASTTAGTAGAKARFAKADASKGSNRGSNTLGRRQPPP